MTLSFAVIPEVQPKTPDKAGGHLCVRGMGNHLVVEVPYRS